MVETVAAVNRALEWIGFQRFVPPPDSNDDLVWVCFPDEWLGFLIVLLDEAVDGGLLIDDEIKDAGSSTVYASVLRRSLRQR